MYPKLKMIYSRSGNQEDKVVIVNQVNPSASLIRNDNGLTAQRAFNGMSIQKIIFSCRVLSLLAPLPAYPKILAREYCLKPKTGKDYLANKTLFSEGLFWLRDY